MIEIKTPGDHAVELLPTDKRFSFADPSSPNFAAFHMGPVRVYPNGEVELVDGASVSDGARAFWDRLQEVATASLAEAFSKGRSQGLSEAAKLVVDTELDNYNVHYLAELIRELGEGASK